MQENSTTPLNRSAVLGAVCGAATMTLPNGSTYVGGSWADNLTSYGCDFPDTSQTKATAFIAAGASGTTGAVIEPYNIPERFTNSSIYTFIADGSTFAEAFAKSVYTPDIQLPLGDMLAQPYADVPKAAVTSGPGNYGAIIGTVSIAASAGLVSPKIATGISQLEMLIDGKASSSGTLGGGKGSFSLSTAGLSDGVHEVRIVAVNNAAAASEGYTVQPIVVDNHGRSINFNGGNLTMTSSAATISLATAAGDGTISQVELTSLGRVLAQGNGSPGSLSVSSSGLAPGDNVIVPVAVFSDGSQVAGGTFTVHVESGPANSWSGGGGTTLWSNTANWSGGVVPQNGDGVARFSSAGHGGTVVLNSSASVEEIDLDNSGGGSYTLAAAAGQTLSLTSSNGPMSQSMIDVLSGNHTISAPLALTALGNMVTVTNATDSLTISGSVSGPGALTKTGAGLLVLSGANSYGGATTVGGGSLQVGAGGTSGSLGGGPVLDNGSLIFNRAGSYTASNAISGDGGLTKLGGGTLVLTAAETYGGRTTVSAGTLQVTGSLANNGSGMILVAKDTDGIFGDGVGDAAIVRRVTAGASYAGLGSAVANLASGELPTSGDIIGGTASAQADVGMAWRTRTAAEKTQAGGGLVSEVIDVTGVAPSGGGSRDGSHQTDMFVLQVSYNPSALLSIWGETEAQAAASGSLHLDYLDLGPDGQQGSADNRWINAVAGDFGGTSNYVGDHSYNSSYFVLGDYGIDTADHVVWAVVNHNSEFAASAGDMALVPEPSTIALLAAGALALSACRVRGRRCSKT